MQAQDGTAAPDCTWFSVLDERAAIPAADVTVGALDTRPDIPNLADATHEITSATVRIKHVPRALRGGSAVGRPVVMQAGGWGGELEVAGQTDLDGSSPGTEGWTLEGFGSSVSVSFG